MLAHLCVFVERGGGGGGGAVAQKTRAREEHTPANWNERFGGGGGIRGVNNLTTGEGDRPSGEGEGGAQQSDGD